MCEQVPILVALGAVKCCLPELEDREGFCRLVGVVMRGLGCLGFVRSWYEILSDGV